MYIINSKDRNNKNSIELSHVEKNFTEYKKWLRYDRQIILPEVGIDGQQKLFEAKVLVAGAGGLGCPVLQYLTAAGIGVIGIADYDAVDITNLQRQVLYDEKDEGKAKVEAAIRKLKKLNPSVKFIPHNLKLTSANVMDIIAGYDLVVDGTDNFPTRFLIGDATAIQNKPLVFGAVYRFLGQVSVLNYKKGPTYRCLFPEQPNDEEIPSCSTAGVLGSLPGIIGCFQATETIKILLDKGNILSGKILQFDLLTFNIELIDIQRDEKNIIKSLGTYGEETKCEVNQVSPEMLNKKLKSKGKIQIVDIRSNSRFNDFNIGGINVSPEEIMENPEMLTSNNEIVLVCEFGIKSRQAAEYLQQKHMMSNILNLEGGILNWNKYKEQKSTQII